MGLYNQAMSEHKENLQSISFEEILKNLADCTDFRKQVKEMTANCFGEWCYRNGNYHLITDISAKTVNILMLEIGSIGKIVTNEPLKLSTAC